MANKIETDQKRISKIETGNVYIGWDTFYKISQALDVSIEELIEGDEKSHQIERSIRQMLVNFTSVCYYNNKRKEGDGMAQKDTSEKILESYNDVFSDIVNVLLFNGKQVLSADELEDQAPRSYYKADGKIREIERDVAKRWKNGNIRVACIGFENQTASDPNMPLRVMGYDGTEYRA